MKKQTPLTLHVKAVNDAPVLTPIKRQTTSESIAISDILFSAEEGGGDGESEQILSLTASSSNTDLIPVDNIEINFSDETDDAGDGSLDIKPVKGKSGESDITLVLSDGFESVAQSFTILVQKVNDPPTISDFENLVIREDEDSDNISFSVDEGGLEDEDVQILRISVSSSNQDLLPDERINVKFADDDFDAESGSLMISPAANAFGKSTVTVVVDDGENKTTKRFDVSVTAVNDAPEAESAVFRTNEDANLVETLVAADVDNDSLIYRIDQFPDSGELKLINSSAGEIEYIPEPDWSGRTEFTFAVSDGKLESAPAAITIEVTAVDDPIYISSIADMTIDEDETVADIKFDVDEGGGIDEDRQILSVTARSSNDELVPNSAIHIDFNDDESDAGFGKISIKPGKDLFGKTDVTIAVSDGNHIEKTEFQLTVNPVNDLPEISEIASQSTSEGTSISGIEFTVDEGGGLGEDKQTVQLSAASLNPQLIPPESLLIHFRDDESDAGKASLDIQPLAGKSGTSEIIITANDGEDRIEQRFTVTVGAINDPPTLSSIQDIEIDEDQESVDVEFEADEGGGLDEGKQILKFYVKSSDPDLMPEDLIRVQFTDDDSDADHGNITLRAKENQSGKCKITLAVDDGLASSSKSFYVTVNPVNDIPIVENISIPVEEDHKKMGQLAAADPDSEHITFMIVDRPEYGQVHILNKQSGEFEFVPDTHWNGETHFTFKANDGISDSKIATASIVVSAVDDPPILPVIDDCTIHEDRTLENLEFAIDEGGGADEDQQKLALTAVSENTNLIPNENIQIQLDNGIESANTASVSITPAADQFGAAVINLTLSDGQNETNTSFKINVDPFNDLPEISEIKDHKTTMEGQSIERIMVALDKGGGDLENEQIIVLTVASSNSKLIPDDAIHVDFVDDQDDADIGYLTIQPASGMSGSSRITVNVSDGFDVVKTSFLVEVDPVDDPPTITKFTNHHIAEDGKLDAIKFTVDEGGGDDEDSQAVTITTSSSNTKLVPNENIFINFSDDATDAGEGMLSVTPIENKSGTTTITVTVDDGHNRRTEQFDVIISQDNDMPEVFDDSVSTSEDNEVFGILKASDPDGDALRFKLLDQPKNGTIELLDPATGKFSYSPILNWVGNDQFTFPANDGQVESKPGKIGLMASAVNDEPTVAKIADQTMDEDSTSNKVELFLDEGGGVDEDIQIVRVMASSSNGALIPDANIEIDFQDDQTNSEPGHITITPLPDRFGSSLIKLTVIDGLSKTESTFNVNVSSV